MKLSQLFSGDTHTENVARPQQSPAQAASMSRQIRSLVPGQTISGEVLSRNGGEVQIKLSDDLVLNARVDRNMNIEVGKNMTFEVKNNGSSLTLSPLFTNVSTDMNVLKALDMAGLPVTETSVSMTSQMMQAGLSVNRNMLQQIFREINSFPQGEMSDVINLHKLQLPVNGANMEQMAAYRNLNHQLIEGMDTILGALPEVFDSMMAEGDMPGAMRLYREVLALVQESGAGENMAAGQEAVLGAETAAGQPAADAPGSVKGEGILPESGEAVLSEGGEAVLPENGEGLLSEGNRAGNVGQEIKDQGTEGGGTAGGTAAAQEGRPAGDQNVQEGGAAGRMSLPDTAVSETLRASMAGEALEILDSLGLPEQAAGNLRARLGQFASGQADAREFFSALSMLADAAKTSEGAMASLQRLFSGREFKTLLAGQFKSFWTLSAEEVAVPGKVEEMYRRLDRQLKGLTQALQNAGQTDSAAFRATVSMSRNVDFLNQVNQMYAYVQLPLRLQQGDAHGELYVYTNKKKLSSKDGTVSALLHLDMEHLGPVDVYVTMQSSKVNTKFYLRDDGMIDFMAAHMDILTERLKKRGYDCSYAMTVRGEGASGATEGGLAPILGQERGVVISQYAFDVRT